MEVESTRRDFINRGFHPPPSGASTLRNTGQHTNSGRLKGTPATLNNSGAASFAPLDRYGTPCFFQRGIPSLPQPHHTALRPSIMIGYIFPPPKPRKSPEPPFSGLISPPTPCSCPVSSSINCCDRGIFLLTAPFGRHTIRFVT